MQRTARNQSKSQPMHFVSFDTHKHIKELQECGFDERQAEVLVRSLLEVRDYDLNKLATKEQLTALQHDLESVKKDVKILDGKISALDEKIDTTTKMLQETIKASTADAKSDMAKYLVSMFIMLALGIAGILVKIW